MGNPEMRMTPPPIPDAAKKREVPDSVKKESAEQVIPDLTSEAVLEDDVIATKNLEYQKQIQADLEEEAIEDARNKVSEAAEKKWFDAGDDMSAAAKTAEADAKAIEKEALIYAAGATRGAGKLEKNRKMLSHEAEQFRAIGKKMTANEVGDQARNNAEVLGMVEKELMKDFGVDIVAMPTAGFWANANLNIRAATDGKLRAKLKEYKELMKISEASLDKMEGKG